ncbi:MAG TPA: 2-oxoacid:ferredoxin oxidoreductase subunit beta [Planctomycetota bacterium]|jgi:2-oxoglutarate ferredoxin oxidoreductase subunit beta|nr:2-oxoacid:ferredoxin oxidoreductase subunit beta [Planctomycetota bacterium]
MSETSTVPKNRSALTKADYRGGKSTLCPGCGHDAITSSIIEAAYDYGLEPERVIKLSGIGCSSKTPAYFLNRSHGFNAVHGRMPAVATGAFAANRTLVPIGVSGDGDTASIGMGQFVHLVRRNVPCVYLIENNGVYGLTKGQFSATADVGSVQKGGRKNELPPIDCCAVAIELGCGFVARSFSADPRQLRPILKAAFGYPGTAVIDVVSPCVTFNDHEGSTKSYDYAKSHDEPLHMIGFVPFWEHTEVEIAPGEVRDVEMPDGSHLRLQKLRADHDPSDALQAMRLIHEARQAGRLITGLLYFDPKKRTFADEFELIDAPLATLPEEKVRPSRRVLEEIMTGYRVGSA